MYLLEQTAETYVPSHFKKVACYHYVFELIPNHASFNSILNLTKPSANRPRNKRKWWIHVTVYYKDNSLCQDVGHYYDFPLRVQCHVKNIEGIKKNQRPGRVLMLALFTGGKRWHSSHERESTVGFNFRVFFAILSEFLWCSWIWQVPGLMRAESGHSSAEGCNVPRRPIHHTLTNPVQVLLQGAATPGELHFISCLWRQETFKQNSAVPLKITKEPTQITESR